MLLARGSLSDEDQLTRAKLVRDFLELGCCPDPSGGIFNDNWIVSANPQKRIACLLLKHGLRGSAKAGHDGDQRWRDVDRPQAACRCEAHDLARTIMRP